MTEDDLRRFVDRWCFQDETDDVPEQRAKREEMYYELKELVGRSVLIPKLEHEWEFYMNGSFCRRCGAQLGSGVPCK